MFFSPLKNWKHLEKFSKFAKNEVKAVKVAVLAASHGVSHKTLMGTQGGLRDPQGHGLELLKDHFYTKKKKR